MTDASFLSAVRTVVFALQVLLDMLHLALKPLT
jgi:hypothetical protein